MLHIVITELQTLYIPIHSYFNIVRELSCACDVFLLPCLAQRHKTEPHCSIHVLTYKDCFRLIFRIHIHYILTFICILILTQHGLNLGSFCIKLESMRKCVKINNCGDTFNIKKPSNKLFADGAG